MKKALIFEAVILLCVGVSLILVLLPQPKTMIDFPMYTITETEEELVVYTHNLVVDDEENIKAVVGEGSELAGSLGAGVSSELYPVYQLPSDNILSLGEGGRVKLVFSGETIELDGGETDSRTVYHWFSRPPTSFMPGLLHGILLYETYEVRNHGYADEIMNLESGQTVRFGEVKPVLIEFWHVQGGTRFFVSPNLVVFSLLLGWNTLNIRRRK